MMDRDELLEDYIRENYEVYDRFTFDYVFKRLLKDGYSHEEAKDVILNSCALSALVLQKRIHNDFYLEINEDDVISADLLELRNEIYRRHFSNRN